MDMMRFQKNFPKIKTIIIIACDSDFVPAIKQLKAEGIKIILYTYFDRKRNSLFSRYNNLLKTASKWVKLNQEDFQ